MQSLLQSLLLSYLTEFSQLYKPEKAITTSNKCLDKQKRWLAKN